MIRYILFAILLALAIPAHAAGWKAKEQIKHYTVSGETGFQLYEAIGGSGPLIGKSGRQVRAVAHTTFDLKWRRDYQPEGSACVLRSSFPFLTVIYTLPKATGKLPPALRARWNAFSEGIAGHEKVHGKMIVEMVEQLVDDLTGLRMENDAGCKKIRTRVLEIVKAAYAGYAARSRDFDRVEMSQGGNVQKLILGLVNG